MKHKLIISLLAIIVFTFSVQLIAGDLDLGADVYSRYVWRGTDFGNTPAIQPYISFSHGPLEIGAWSSWSITGAGGGNENDLYATLSFSNFSLTVTDYYFPGYTGDDLIDDFGEAGGHTIEVSGGAEFGSVSLVAGMNVAGNDPDNSSYVEVGYNFYNKEDLSSSVFVGAGDNFYTMEGDMTVVNVGLSVSKDKYSAAYIINPDQKTSFLIFGVSF